MNVMGQAVAQINKCFHPAGTYPKTGHEEGQSFFERLDREEQESLVEFAWRENAYAAKVEEPDFKKYLKAQCNRMKGAEEAKLIKTVKQVPGTMTYFEKQLHGPGRDEAKSAPAAEQVGEGGVASGENLHPREGLRLD